jgi:aminomethyltransferase
MVQESLRTPLYASHVALNARMVPFAGYDMPVQYDSVIAESRAVRESAGMFDVSHMARLWFKGPRVVEYLDWITTNDVAALTDGHGHYSLLPNDKGGLVDDIIVYRISEGVFRMVVNASNHAKDVAWMKSKNDFGVEIVDETDETSMIAVQGPKAIEILAKLSDKPDELKKAAMFDLVDCTIAGVKCFAPRSGYTGEPGCELICANADAVKLWDALLAAGVKPCGLGSRDVLRVEAGLPLYGHELSDELSPIAAGLGWVIGKTKRFVGSEFINKARAEGTPRKLQGVKLHSKRLITPGMKVMLDGNEIGEVTSGIYSPILDCGAAFAFVDAGVPLGSEVAVEIRGKLEPGTLVGKRLLKK